VAVSPLVLDPEVQRRPLTRALYDDLVSRGAFDGEPVELIEGELITMAPQGEPHASAVDLLSWRLDRSLMATHGEAYRIRQEKPFAASDRSEPEPDIVVIDAAMAVWGAPHPSWAHLVVEVAESSLGFDLRHKPRVYAGSSVPVYWVVDVVRRRTTVHREPRPGADPHYQDVVTVPFSMDLAVLEITLRLDDILR
jgi:Uma2 family endonuclease